MIKALQKKFIVAAMIAITVLLLVLLGMINTVNAWSTEQQSDRMLTMLLDNEISLAPQWPQNTREDRGFLAPPVSEDQAMSAVYFCVRISNSGVVTKMDVSRIVSVTEADAEEMALQAYGQSRDSGKIRHFRYRAAATPSGNDTVFVFLDTSTQTVSVLRVLILSVLAGILCWLLMLLLVILLSKKAIRPIAVNLEKQKQFITDAGHEIKTPLAIILANTDAMELHSGVSKWSQNIRAQTVRLNGLMQNLLTLAKLDEGNVHLDAEAIVLSQLLEESLHSFEEAAELKGISIQKEIQPDVTIHGNRDSIARLLSILMDNAVQYSPPEGRITISLQLAEKQAVLRIKNACENRPAEDPGKLFDRFYRGDSARTQKSGGYGIGLSAARAIAELYKGTITAQYEGRDWIIFTVRLPST